MGAFSRSWTITKLSFSVIGKDMEILLFPILGGVLSLFYIVILVFPLNLLGIFKYLDKYNADYIEWIGLFLLYLGVSFFATFFNVCTIYTAKTRFEGGDATFLESIQFALSKLSKIFVWGFISATIGVILRIIDKVCEKAQESDNIVVSILGFVGGIIISLFGGVAWGLVSAFVLPVMVYHDTGPIDALKRSSDLLEKTWGEGLIREFGLGLVGGMIMVTGIAIFAGLGFLAAGLGKGFVIAVIVAGTIFVVAFTVVFSLLNTIFNTALFVYADQGAIPFGYDKDVLSAVFRVSEKK